MKKRMISMFALALAMFIMIPTAFAATVAMERSDQSAEYAISMGSGRREWNGKSENKLWKIEKVETKWYVSILTQAEREVNADLRYVVELWPDSTVLSMTVKGMNGASECKGPFVPANVSHGYYAVISTENEYGVTGRTTIRQ